MMMMLLDDDGFYYRPIAGCFFITVVVDDDHWIIISYHYLWLCYCRCCWWWCTKPARFLSDWMVPVGIFFTEAWATMIWTTTYAITSGPWDIHIRSVVSWTKGWPNLESRNQTIRNWRKKTDLVVDDHFPLFSWHIFWGIPWYTSCISPIGSSEVLLSTDMRNDSTKAVPSDLSAAEIPTFRGGFRWGFP